MEHFFFVSTKSEKTKKFQFPQLKRRSSDYFLGIFSKKREQLGKIYELIKDNWLPQRKRVGWTFVHTEAHHGSYATTDNIINLWEKKLDNLGRIYRLISIVQLWEIQMDFCIKKNFEEYRHKNDNNREVFYYYQTRFALHKFIFARNMINKYMH